MNKTFQVEEIEKYVKQKKYGDTITFSELQVLTDYNLKDKFESYKFKSNIMRKIKIRLLQYGIVLKSIRNLGYYILKPNQIQSYTYRTYIIRPLKHLEKAEMILINTKTEKLNKNELEKHKQTIDLDISLLKISNNLIKDEKYQDLA